jgi:uncharacterized protein YcaQ
MPTPIVVDKAHARRFLLAHLRLHPPRTLRGKQGVLDYIRHVNCIQYDPINVVGQKLAPRVAIAGARLQAGDARCAAL